jgi:hypothetical protein
MKSDIRMRQNYLLGEKVVPINVLISTTAWNLKKILQKLKKMFFQFVFIIVFQQNYMAV